MDRGDVKKWLIFLRLRSRRLGKNAPKVRSESARRSVACSDSQPSPSRCPRAGAQASFRVRTREAGEDGERMSLPVAHLVSTFSPPRFSTRTLRPPTSRVPGRRSRLPAGVPCGPAERMQPGIPRPLGAEGKQRVLPVFGFATAEAAAGRRARRIAVEPFGDTAGECAGLG
jgi:hypothetical protein